MAWCRMEGDLALRNKSPNDWRAAMGKKIPAVAGSGWAGRRYFGLSGQVGRGRLWMFFRTRASSAAWSAQALMSAISCRS